MKTVEGGPLPRLRTASSVLAVGLIMAPLVLGAILAFPIWDDGWLWLVLKEQGPEAILVGLPDRPVMASLWVLLATVSEETLWATTLVAQAVLLCLLAFISARLWVHLFPDLAGYAWVVAALSVSTVLSKVQMVLAHTGLGSLPPVVLAYLALLLVLRYVTRPGTGILDRSALPLSAVALAAGVLVQEYAVPVALVTIALLIPHLWDPSDAAVRRRALKGIATVAVTAVVAYSAYRVLADTSVQSGVGVEPTLILNPRRLVLIPFILVMAVWRGVAVNVAMAVESATAKLSVVWPDAARPDVATVVAVLYGALVAALLVYGGRTADRGAVIEVKPRETTDRRQLVTVLAALIVGLFPVVAMRRVPWDPADAMTTRFGLPVLPILAVLIVRLALGVVSRRWWAIPVILLGFTVGSVTVADVWGAIRERQTVTTMGTALEPRVAATEGLTVAVVSLPERPLGPRRQLELTARLTANWPAQLRERFWAYRVGGGPPLFYPEEATLLFGRRATCRAPRTVNPASRPGPAKRRGDVSQFLFVAPGVDGAVVIEPYCLRDE